MMNEEQALRGRVEVKALEWRHFPSSNVRDEEWVGSGACDYHAIVVADSTFRLLSPTSASASFAKLDEAKAAAQADYTARILSALVLPSPAIPEGARAVVYIDGDGKSLVPDDQAAAFKAAWDALPEMGFGRKVLPLYLRASSPPLTSKLEAAEAALREALAQALFERTCDRAEARGHEPHHPRETLVSTMPPSYRDDYLADANACIQAMETVNGRR